MTKANALEELLIDLSNEVMDHHRDFTRCLKKYKESELDALQRSEKITSAIFGIFKEIGREKSV